MALQVFEARVAPTAPVICRHTQETWLQPLSSQVLGSSERATENNYNECCAHCWLLPLHYAASERTREQEGAHSLLNVG